MSAVELNYAAGITYTTEHLREALKSVGVEKGDCICVHTDLSTFGERLISDKKEYLNAILEVLFDVIGNSGTLIMPTFSYSFCDNKDFDVINTPTKMGVLPEFFRKLHTVKRTLDPIFSFAIGGAKQDEYLNIPNDCFGAGSVYDRLLKDNGKLILLGNKLRGYTFLHYIEQNVSVPYRYFKEFKGTILKETGEKFETTFRYYVRCLDRSSEVDIKKIIEYLQINDKFRQSQFGFGEIVGFNTNDFYTCISEKIKEDVNFFLLEDRG